MKSKRGPLRADVAWSVMWQEVPTSPARQGEEGIHLSAASPLTHHIPIIAGAEALITSLCVDVKLDPSSVG